MPADFRRVEWAGIAVRMSDGTLYAFEMDGWVEGSVVIEEDLDLDLMSFGDSSKVYGRYREPHIRVDLSGRGRASAVFKTAAERQTRRPAIEEPPKMIEGGRG